MKKILTMLFISGSLMAGQYAFEQSTTGSSEGIENKKQVSFEDKKRLFLKKLKEVEKCAEKATNEVEIKECKKNIKRRSGGKAQQQDMQKFKSMLK